MIDEVEGAEAPRKGKSNAILTYETVAGLDRQLTALNTKFDFFLETQAERKMVQDALLLATGSLDKRLTIIETKTDTSKGMLREGWAVLIAVLSLAISAFGAIWHIHT